MTKRYSKYYMWVEADNTSAKVGISYHALDEIGEIENIELLCDPGSEILSKGYDIIRVEGDVGRFDALLPLTGAVTKENPPSIAQIQRDLVEGKKNSSWIYELRIEAPEEHEDLMDQASYEAWCARPLAEREAEMKRSYLKHRHVNSGMTREQRAEYRQREEQSNRNLARIAAAIMTRQGVDPDKVQIMSATSGPLADQGQSDPRRTNTMTRYYTDDHEWIDVDGDEATIGITAYAAEQLGDVVFIELKEADETFAKGDDMGVIESVKAASDIYAPVSCEIIEGNTALEDEPADINEDPESNAWLYKVKILDASELNELMDEAAYKAMIG